MGAVSWGVAGVVALGVTRLIRKGRGPSWGGEAAVALAAALLLGVAATAADFGGWREPDWRAALFAFLGALAATGALRLLRVRKPAAG